MEIFHKKPFQIIKGKRQEVNNMLKWDIKLTNESCPSRERLIRGKDQEVYICHAKHQARAFCLCDRDDCPKKIGQEVNCTVCGGDGNFYNPEGKLTSICHKCNGTGKSMS